MYKATSPGLTVIRVYLL